MRPAKKVKTSAGRSSTGNDVQKRHQAKKTSGAKSAAGKKGAKSKSGTGGPEKKAGPRVLARKAGKKVSNDRVQSELLIYLHSQPFQ